MIDVNENYFKYRLEKGNGSISTPRNLSWFDRMKYRIKGYKVIKVD